MRCLAGVQPAVGSGAQSDKLVLRSGALERVRTDFQQGKEMPPRQGPRSAQRNYEAGCLFPFYGMPSPFRPVSSLKEGRSRCKSTSG